MSSTQKFLRTKIGKFLKDEVGLDCLKFMLHYDGQTTITFKRTAVLSDGTKVLGFVTFNKNGKAIDGELSFIDKFKNEAVVHVGHKISASDLRDAERRADAAHHEHEVLNMMSYVL